MNFRLTRLLRPIGPISRSAVFGRARTARQSLLASGLGLISLILLSTICYLLSTTPKALAAVSRLTLTPKDTSISIYWSSSISEPSTIKFGLSPTNLTGFKTDPIPVSFHSLSFSNLTPNTTYYFHIVESKNDQPTLTSTFRTLPSVIASGSVAIQAFTKNLKLGMTDPEVKQLQLFLNSQGILIAQSGPGSKGNETNYFGPATSRAVTKFQELYAKDILIPNNLTKGTGAVLGSTRAKLNQLLALTKKNAPVASTQPVIQTPSYYSGGGGGGGSSPSPSSPTPTPSPTVPPPAAGPSPTPSPSGSSPSPSPTPAPTYIASSECNDGIDNDGDGLIDMMDTGGSQGAALGCFGPNQQETITDYGFTIFAPSLDSKIYYVSATGDDANDGLSSMRPKKTFAAAAALLRNGYPDWVLLKRGDRWTKENFAITTSGRSESEPRLIGSYGTLSARPQIVDGYLWVPYQGNISNIAISGLHIERMSEATSLSDVGISLLGYGSNMLVEDCYVGGFKDNLLVQGAGGSLNNFKVRNSVVVDSFSSGGGHSQGIFMENAHTVIIENNIFDHNGWKEGLAGAEATIFNHNLYLDATNSGVTVRNNITARASATGLQQRSGGSMENNLSLSNPIGFLFGNAENDWNTQRASGVIHNNVVLDGRDIWTGVPRGFGMMLEKSDGVEVSRNILADQVSGSQGIGLNISSRDKDINIHDNIFYNWSGQSANSTFSLRMNMSNALPNEPVGVVQFKNNILQTSLPGLRLVVQDSPLSSAYQYAGNSYYWGNAPHAGWWEVQNSGKDQNEWIAASGEVGAKFGATIFSDPSRTIATYHQSIGGGASLESFLVEARKQSRLYWRPQYGAPAVNDYIRAGFQVLGFTPLVAPSPNSSPSPTPNPTPTPSPTPSPTPVPQSGGDVTNGLVLRYAFDGSANDSVGANNGTIMNGASFTTGKISQALSFDGVDDYVNLGTPISQSDPNLTVSAWVKTNNPSVGGPVLTTNNFLIDINLVGDNRVKLTKWGVADIFIGPYPADTAWHHLVVVYSSTGVVMYVDGVIRSETSANGSSFTTESRGNQIGHSTEEVGGLRYFSGQIDDLRIYNRALTAADVAGLYNGGAGIAHSAPTPSFFASLWTAFSSLFR